MMRRTRAGGKQVTTASLNPFRGYATALRTSVPEAVQVLDAFHVVRLGKAAVDDVRRRQQETLGRRGLLRPSCLFGAARLRRCGRALARAAGPAASSRAGHPRSGGAHAGRPRAACC
jgi:transposase